MDVEQFYQALCGVVIVLFVPPSARLVLEMRLEVLMTMAAMALRLIRQSLKRPSINGTGRGILMSDRSYACAQLRQ